MPSPQQSKTELEQAIRKLQRVWRPDPPLFAEQALGMPVWSKQEEILRALAPPGSWVVVRSGHKVGKTRLGATALHWFATNFDRARSIFTGPTYPNIANVIWPEVRHLYKESRHNLGGHMYDELRKGILYGQGRNQIFGLTTKDAEAMAGLSGANMLFLIDEASGVKEEIYEALIGNLAGNARLLMLGNPTRTSGSFYEAFHANREAYKTFHLDSRETPNFNPDLPDIPGLASPEWLEKVKILYPPGTAQFDVRVAGNFPRQGENSVIALGDVESSQNRGEERCTELYGDEDPRKVQLKPEQINNLESLQGEQLSIGVDVARFGDDESVICALRGDTMVALIGFTGIDNVTLAGRVVELACKLRKPTEQPPQVKVDVSGTGSGVVDMLYRLQDKVRVYGVDAGSSPTSQPKLGPGWSQLRDQLWFGCSRWLATVGELPTGTPHLQRLESELVAPVYDFDVRGRQRVEPKKETKKRVGRSPDRADALCLAVYEPPGIHIGEDRRPKKRKRHII